MKAIGYLKSLPISDLNALVDFDADMPVPGSRDVLVEIKAIAVNPVDAKIRCRFAPENDRHKILGWDAAGVVRSVGDDVLHFKPGDEVYYAGDLTRDGCNAEFQTVDERIVGHKPHSLSFAEAAALPLTSLTAWELLFERMGIAQDGSEPEGSVVIMGAAGGVGSIASQLLKALTNLSVIGSASRPETQSWLSELGVDHLIDHRKDLRPQFEELEKESNNYVAPNYVASLNQTDRHYEALAEIMRPQGKFGLIDDPEAIDIKAFKRKSISLHWEFMYTRSMFGTDDMEQQRHILNQVAALVDQRKLRTTLQKNLGAINAKNLKLAHATMERGSAIGKVVLEGFE